jgi:hypothetical protein
MCRPPIAGTQLERLDAVLPDEQHAPLLFDHHTPRLGAKGHSHSVGQGRGAMKEFFPGRSPEEQVFVCHIHSPDDPNSQRA